ncbi:MAG: hypothetical protein JNK77_04775 [Saprospiraceae bacterium]|nr:hypothetical protein [Saprospiraceae bacterium]
MKDAFITAIATLFFSMTSLAQTCLPDGIILTTQAQVDSFPILYPGCATILGDMTIGESNGGIHNLSPLSGINSIGGSLVILGNSGLSSLSGLDNITTIGENFNLQYNANLTNLTGLGQLSHIGGFFSINENINLENLEGLTQLNHIGDYLHISYNHALVDISALSQIDSLFSLLLITHNYSLPSLTGLENLTYIGKDCYLSANISLDNLAALHNLRYIKEVLSIRNMHALTNLAGLENLTYVEGLDIYQCSGLESLDGLSQLDTIAVSLYVRSNLQLAGLYGLSSLDFVGDRISLIDNTNLSQCAIDVVCNHLLYNADDIEIENNALGCINKLEVEDSCNIEVGVYAPQLDNQLWRVLGTPMRSTAVFAAQEMIPGEKQFRLLDAGGRIVRSDRFDGQEYVFDRGALPGGVYFFQIIDARGRAFTGKLVIAR